MKTIRHLLTIILTMSALWAGAQSTKKADSLYIAKNWSAAIEQYQLVVTKDSKNALAWNRLGYSYHNLGEFKKAKQNYLNALANTPSQMLEQVVSSRLSRIYSVENNLTKSVEYLNKSLALGFAKVEELNTNMDFENLRKDPSFPELLKKTVANAFPCMQDMKSREFDFWVGEWDVFDTGSKEAVGKSRIEMASGGCMILENFYGIEDPPFEGKSMNFVNAKTGKWEQLWAGPEGISETNPRKFVDGEYFDGAMRFKYELEIKGIRKIGKFTFYNSGANEVRQVKESSSDQGKTWNTVYDYTYKRKKS